MKPEQTIAAGNSIDEVLIAFRQSVNQPGTIFSTDHWLFPKLDQLQLLLTNPITEDEALALLDVLYQRHWMSELIAWLENGAVSWADFFGHQANLKKEDLQKRADERDRGRTAGTDPWSDLELFPDEAFPKISDRCPDCGSSDWKPIGYGLPSEDTLEDARRGHLVLGGCVIEDAKRYCVDCFNRWPTKPDMSRPRGKPEWIQRQIAETLFHYTRLCSLAEQAAHSEEPQVEHAWARIDGHVEFLLAFSGGTRARVSKTLEYSRLGGAPAYEVSISAFAYEKYAEACELAKVAVVRFERTHEPEKHNLYNDWDKVQTHRRKVHAGWDEASFEHQLAKANRDKLCKLLKLARAAPEKLPKVLSIHLGHWERIFLVRFPWGAVRVRRHAFSPLELFQYDCSGSCWRTEDSEAAEDLACAAAMLAEFPRLVRA